MGKRQGNVLIIILGIVLVVSAGLAGFFYWSSSVKTTEDKQNQPLTWDECLKIPGATQLMTYPGQCVTPDGRKVIQTLSDEEKKKLEIESETASWKIFTNNEFFYSFKYPNDWKVTPSIGEGVSWGHVLVSRPVLDSNTTKFVIDVGINYGKFTRPLATSSASWTTEVTYLTISGVSATKYRTFSTQNPSSGEGQTSVILSYKGLDYAFLLRDNHYQEIYDQLLSTFKFIDQTSINGTSGIYGVVTLGPTCPVERPGQTCTAPFAGIIEFVRQTGDSAEITRVTTQADGSFRVNLAPGDYVAERTDTKMFNLAKTKIHVTENQFSQVNVDFDTGIR